MIENGNFNDCGRLPASKIVGGDTTPNCGGVADAFADRDSASDCGGVEESNTPSALESSD